MNKSEAFSRITKQTIERYSKRLSELGHDVRTLGWGSSSQQIARFQNLLNTLDLSGKSILDIGCGFGDLFSYLKSENIPFRGYLGWDVNDKFIDLASSSYHLTTAEFAVFDMLNESPKAAMADVGVMLGLLNYNYGSQEINQRFVEQMLSNAFKTVNDCLFVDFISTYRDPTYPYEDFIYYQDPSIMLKIGLSMTSNLRLLHDYAPIPQKEFSLILYK